MGFLKKAIRRVLFRKNERSILELIDGISTGDTIITFDATTNTYSFSNEKDEVIVKKKVVFGASVNCELTSSTIKNLDKYRYIFWELVDEVIRRSYGRKSY